ncbi:ATP-binding protein [Streptomyces sp. NPDC048111]|uniref:ATP-binding protein n=1 Tax=Streptomyces sp. NPDC048111 TaxID=3365500 RepID=UPI0037209865
MTMPLPQLDAEAPNGAFPYPTAAVPHPADSAPAGPGLIGREAELRTVEGALRDPATRVVTLAGPTGVGKSRLAAAAVALLRAEGSDGPGSRAVFATVHTALADAAPADGRHLLLLDDCDHELRPRAESLGSLLAVRPQLTVLVTALEPLGLYGERLIPVAPLPVPLPHEVEEGDAEALGRVASVALFTERAARSCPGFALTAENAGAVARICRLLEGLPAALELAAGRIRHYPPAALLARLRRDPAALSGGPSAAPERHRSLAALVAWGLRGLTSAERALVERLSVHEGGFAPHVLGRSDEGALDELLERGALRLSGTTGAAEPRYAVPEPTRSYCLARLAEADGGRLGAVADEHADRYARLAASAAPRLAGPERAHWFGVLADEALNVLAALERLAVRGDRATAAATVLACREPWLAQGRLRDGAAWCDRLLAEDGPALPEPLVAQLTELAGVFALARGDAAEAARRQRSALALGKRLGDRRRTALIGAQLGAALLAADDPRAALAALEPAATTLESVGAVAAAARARTDLAWAQRELGRTRAAVDLLEQARAALRRVGDGRGLTEALRRRAALHTDTGEHEAADRALREALELADEWREQTQLPLLLEEFALSVLRLTPAQRPRVVRLLTAADALAARLGAARPEPRRATLDEATAGLEARLGWTAYTRARAEGLALDPAGAVREALASPAPARAAAGSEADPQSLTPRQVQVAMLVSEGRTNRQIAAELGLSEWTVVNHVRQIMRRLGCSSRIQVAWATGRWS